MQEKNLLEWTVFIWNRRASIFKVWLASVILISIINLVSTSEYRSMATFITYSDASSGNPLLGYARAFGVQAPDNIEDKIQIILKSERIKKSLQKKHGFVSNGAKRQKK